MAEEGLGLRLGELLQQQQQHVQQQQTQQQQTPLEVPQQPQRRRFSERLAGIVTSAEGPSTVAPFVQKLYELLNDPVSRPFVEWSGRHAGRAFVVWDPVKFAATVLPRYFKHSNFCSFVRQLNIYGFHKLPSDAGCVFQHELFRQNAAFLLSKIQRRRPRRRVLVPVPSGSAADDESPPAPPSPALSFSSSTSSAATIPSCEQAPDADDGTGLHEPPQSPPSSSSSSRGTDEQTVQMPLPKREETASTRAAVGAVAVDEPEAEETGVVESAPVAGAASGAAMSLKTYDALMNEIAQLQRQNSEMHRSLVLLQDAVVHSRSREDCLCFPFVPFSFPHSHSCVSFNSA